MTKSTPTVELSATAPQFKSTSSARNIGLIALSTDLTTERDFAHIMPIDEVGVFATRVQYDNPTTPENLLAMQPRIEAAAELILPEVDLAAICYSCTAASVVIGDEAIATAIHKTRPGVPVVTPTHAAQIALRTLGARRISILTPYLIETSTPMANYFAESGFEVDTLQCLGIDDDRDMARVTDETIIEAAIAANQPESEALFISCTGLPAVNVIAEIEKRLNKPVVTSNQAQAWIALAHANVSSTIEGYGQLFTHRPSAG